MYELSSQKWSLHCISQIPGTYLFKIMKMKRVINYKIYAGSTTDDIHVTHFCLTQVTTPHAFPLDLDSQSPTGYHTKETKGCPSSSESFNQVFSFQCCSWILPCLVRFGLLFPRVSVGGIWPIEFILYCLELQADKQGGNFLQLL
jgi:hypothetical protein